MSQPQKLVIFREFDTWGLDNKSYRPSTSYQYRRIALSADTWMSEHRRRSIFSAREEDFKAYLFSCKPTAPRRNQIRQALDAFCEYLVAENYRADNPIAELPRIKERKKVVRVPERDTTRALWAEAKSETPMVTALVGVYLWGGLRRDEGRLLMWPQIESDAVVVETGSAKGGNERRVPMHPELAWALRRWRVECPSAQWVFPSTRYPDRPISKTWVRSLIKELGERLGFRLHPHLMRHAIATEMCDQGANVRAVQVFMGHASLATTEQYMHVHDPRVKEAVLVANFEPQ